MTKLTPSGARALAHQYMNLIIRIIGEAEHYTEGSPSAEFGESQDLQFAGALWALLSSEDRNGIIGICADFVGTPFDLTRKKVEAILTPLALGFIKIQENSNA